MSKIYKRIVTCDGEFTFHETSTGLYTVTCDVVCDEDIGVLSAEEAAALQRQLLSFPDGYEGAFSTDE